MIIKESQQTDKTKLSRLFKPNKTINASLARALADFLLTEHEVCTELLINRTRARRARFVQKDRGPIFLCTYTEQARLIKSLLYGIYRHLYLKQTRNA
jgi:hypothetical protein